MRRLLLACVAAAALPALAQSPWYAGVAAGRSETRPELVANRESTITLASDLHTDFDARDTAWKAFAGFRFNRVIALELDYTDLGEHRMRTTLQGGSPPLPAAIEIRRRISGYGLDLVATAPLDLERFSVYGRLGAYRSRLEASATLDGNIVFSPGNPEERTRSVQRTETVMRFGVGAQYRFTPRLAARVEYLRHEDIGKPFAVGGTGTTGEADTDLLSAALVFLF